MKGYFWFFTLLGASLPASMAQWAWHQTLSPHFIVEHESTWMPPGFITNIEKMHGRLRMDLAIFSPGMADERLQLYLYEKRQSYISGEFKPPNWSNGIAMYQMKTIALFDQPNRRKLLEILAHETTHLLFEGYWGESHKSPPSWLNEGLAMMEESQSLAAPEASGWYRSMAYLPRASLLPLGDFFKIKPSEDLQNDKNGQVGVWYVQAYSIVSFLYRQHSRIQFKDFCSRLRDGKDLQDTLWIVYRYRRFSDFEKAWLNWFQDPAHRSRVEKAPVEAEPKAQSDAPGFKPIKSFESFRH